VIIKASIGVDRDPTSAIAALATLALVAALAARPPDRDRGLAARHRAVYRASTPPRSFELDRLGCC
jgi:hypothetical protein